MGGPSRHLMCGLVVAALAATTSCASDAAPAVVRSESTPGPGTSDAADTTAASDTTAEPATTDEPETTDPEDVDTTSPSTADSSPPSGPPTVDTQSSTTVDPGHTATTVDPKALEDAIAQWGAVCADVVAGLAALPADVSAALGELARVISDLSTAAGAIPATGAPDDPTEGVRTGMANAATSLTDAAFAFAGGDQAEVQRLLDEALSSVELILTQLRDFGADC